MGTDAGGTPKTNGVAVQRAADRRRPPRGAASRPFARSPVSIAFASSAATSARSAAALLDAISGRFDLRAVVR
jgi:hypothetical protein